MVVSRRESLVQGSKGGIRHGRDPAAKRWRPSNPRRVGRSGEAGFQGRARSMVVGVQGRGEVSPGRGSGRESPDGIQTAQGWSQGVGEHEGALTGDPTAGRWAWGMQRGRGRRPPYHDCGTTPHILPLAYGYYCRRYYPLVNTAMFRDRAFRLSVIENWALIKQYWLQRRRVRRDGGDLTLPCGI